MARGRPPNPKPDPSNVSKATFLEFYDEAVDTKAALDSARSKHQGVFKRAENAGINRAALSRALKEANRERDKREIDDRDYRRYMEWLGMPLGHQAAFDLAGGAEPAAQSENGQANGHDPAAADAESEADKQATEAHVQRVAYHQGREAGRVGANVDSCPFKPGTEDNQLWHSGWHAGQSEVVNETMSSRRRRSKTDDETDGENLQSEP